MAGGYKPKRIDTPAGTISVDVPKSAGHEGAPFYPQSLERGRRSVRAVMLAVAEMYIKGVSTREVEAVMREFGIEGLSSTQVSRAARLLDDELEAWRTRSLGEIRYLVLDARYEKMRHGGIVRDAAVLSAVGIGPDERRRVLGVSVALSEAEVHWRAFLESLQARGMRGVEYVVSDDHAGLRAARRAVLGGATWQRCQFHLAQNAVHHAPNISTAKRIGAELRAVWNAASLAKSEAALTELVATYRDTARKLAAWPEENVPEGLAVFAQPEAHRRRMRTSKPMERAVRAGSSSGAPSRSGCSQTRPRSSASSAPCWSRSTTDGPPTPKPTSNGNARMRDHASAESPDHRSLNPAACRVGHGNREPMPVPRAPGPSAGASTSSRTSSAAARRSPHPDRHL